MPKVGLYLKSLSHGISRGISDSAHNIWPIVFHWMTICLLVLCMLVVNLIFVTTGTQPHLDPVKAYGYPAVVALYFLRLIPLLSVPFCVTNILGIVLVNAYPPPPKFRHDKSSIPFLCFRVVTRGLFPDLVKQTIDRNINVCHKVGLENYKFEVVTDKKLDLKPSGLVKELVVPDDFVTRNKSLYKARALTYCNEPTENITAFQQKSRNCSLKQAAVTRFVSKSDYILSDNDWVIHLDEETVLTESAVIGLANFACDDTSDIGQGTIMYASEDIVNWMTTLADSVRVALDYGMMRFCFRVLGCPLMGSKGSFLIIRERVEKDIGFDFGPKGSITEDLMFVLEAWHRGFRFDFVEGVMLEKSPFSIRDYFEQRKRWFIGHMFTLLSPEIPVIYKLGLIPTDLGWFLLFGNIVNLPVSIIFPLPLPITINITSACIGGTMLFMFLFGSINSFSTRTYGIIGKIAIIIMTILTIPLSACLDGAASLCGFWTRHSGGFYIVSKKVT